MATALTRALGEEVQYNAVSPEEVQYNAVSPEVYRSFGFPGADDMGNMFQFKRDFNDYFRRVATSTLHGL